MKTLKSGLLYALGVLCLSLSCLAQSPRVINTAMGNIAGEISPGQDLGGSAVHQFLGVPYARPPMAGNRFRAPVYPEPQTEALPVNTQKHERPCYQNGESLQQFLTASETTDENTRLPSLSSEDCLYLNIYSPLDQPELLPVMVFIHGGDFNTGTGNAYKGTEIARLNDVIVVNFNYRLGVFGFLQSNENGLSGNLGILDQQMALRWVKENIQNFGGDRERITVFGEEAGGSSVHLHLLMDEGGENFTSLFNNAIIQSATYEDGLWTEEQSMDAYRELIANLEEATGKTNITSDDLQDEAVFSSTLLLQASSVKWHPTVSLLGGSPSKFMEEGKTKKGVNVIVGSNSAAGKTQQLDLSGDDWLANVTEEVLSVAFTQKYGLVTDDDVVKKMSKNYLQFYSWFGVDDAAAISRVRESFSAVLYGDQVYRTWSQSIAESWTSTCNCSVYEYLFDKSSTGDQTVPNGAQLSDELEFLFGYVRTDTLLTQRLQSMWTTFAKTGNPNSDSEVESVQKWPTYNDDSEFECRTLVKIGGSGKLTPHTDEVAPRTWKFWEAFYDTLGFSCSSENSTIANDDDDVNQLDNCGQTVGEILGLDMTEETAAILLIVFMTTTGLFVLCCCIIFGCFCHLKRKVKKSVKKMKEGRKGQDNSGFQYKL